jgi:hypothetical protein
MQCPYCEQSATTRIPAVPEQVCGVHANEFWTGLLAFAIARSAGGPQLTTSLSLVSGNEVSTSGAAADAVTQVHPAVWDADRIGAVVAA